MYGLQIRLAPRNHATVDGDAMVGMEATHDLHYGMLPTHQPSLMTAHICSAMPKEHTTTHVRTQPVLTLLCTFTHTPATAYIGNPLQSSMPSHITELGKGGGGGYDFCW